MTGTEESHTDTGKGQQDALAELFKMLEEAHARHALFFVIRFVGRRRRLGRFARPTEPGGLAEGFSAGGGGVGYYGRLGLGVIRPIAAVTSGSYCDPESSVSTSPLTVGGAGVSCSVFPAQFRLRESRLPAVRREMPLACLAVNRLLGGRPGASCEAAGDGFDWPFTAAR